MSLFPSIKHPQKRALLAAYSECAHVTRSAKIAGVRRETHYEWLRSDPEYVAAFKDAETISGDALEDEATRRGQLGLVDYVLYKGEVVMVDKVDKETGEVTRKPLTKRKYSDRLLLAKLKGAKPAKYGDKTEHTGPGGGAIQINVKFV